MVKHLSADVDIVQKKEIESGAINILVKSESRLTAANANAASWLVSVEKDDGDSKENQNMSYYKDLDAKCQCMSRVATRFILLKFVAATTYFVNRTFISARWILTCLRKQMYPIVFEEMLFLKLIRNLWHLGMAFSAIKLQPKAT